MVVQAAVDAGVETWRHGLGAPSSMQQTISRYQRNWALYSGEMFSDVMKRSRFSYDMRVYRNTSLVYKHVESVVNFYATTVYQGDLSTDGKPLPDGTRGAIPIDPQVGDPGKEAQLRLAIAELWSAWNWRENMTMRPMYAAALGDVLTELVDDLDRGFVYPQIVWPGYVVEIELDSNSNVKYYALEYMVTSRDRRTGTEETYKFRKEVDDQEFRYYRDDKPFTDARGHGEAKQANPYGFVPAIWDRHRKGAPGSVRGMSSIDGTWQALAKLNGHLCHGMDYQAKGFAMPILVSGSPLVPQGNTRNRIDLRLPPRRGEPDAIGEEQDYLPVADGAQLMQAVHDVGQMLGIVQQLKDGIIEENPEGSFFRKLAEMSTLTGPGAERALGGETSRCVHVRRGQDTQTVKLHQMALSMCGYRANGGGWAENTRPLTRRQQVFLPYVSGAYASGDMDFGISDRYVVPRTEQERIDLVISREQVQTRQGLIELGYSDDVPEGEGAESEVDRILAERERGQAAAQRTFDRGAVPAGFNDEE